MSEPLSLRLLGPALVERNSRAVHSLSPGKALALLGYLAVRRQPLSREHLADLFWQDLPAERGRANLSWTLHKLAPLLPGCLEARRRTVEFRPLDGCWIDLDALQALIARGDEGSLAEAAALYRGEFLQGLALDGCADFELWLVGERERWRQRAEHALHELIARCARRGDCEEALRFARRLLALAPWREETHRTAMRLLAESGQRGAALAQYGACRRALEDELGVAPSAETVALYERIRDGEIGALSPPAVPAAPAPPHNLPAPATTFVGRETLLAEVAERLSDPACRLLTLAGPGGSGKTRLALEAATAQARVDVDVARRYADGIYWVSLAPLRSAETLAPAVAQAIGFSFYATGGGAPDPRTQLLHYLRNKRMLLILDNAEHLIAAPSGADRGVEGVAMDLLNAAPQVKLLVTSRARLNVPDEHLLPIGGMDLPPPTGHTGPTERRGDAPPLPAAPEAYSAIALFIQSARRVQPGFELDDETLRPTIHICRLVGGMPLALLLAASWLQVLTPAEIARELASDSGARLDLLETDWREVPERQRSMRAVFDHSWSLLTARERGVMRALSVFRGGCTRDAAQQVAGASLRDLRALAGRSMLERTSDGRYQMHELLRQYAAERLHGSPEEKRVVRDRHAAAYAGALWGWAADLKGPRQLETLREIEADLDNARAAWEWAVERGQVEWLDQAMEGLGLFYDWRVRYKEGEAAFRAASRMLSERAQGLPKRPQGLPEASDPSRSVWATAVAWQGLFNVRLGHSEPARQLVKQGLDILDAPAVSGPVAPGLVATGDTRQARAFVLRMMGEISYYMGGYDEARPLYAQSVRVYRAPGERWEMAQALSILGALAESLSEFDLAERQQQESLAIRRALEDQRGIVESLERLAIVFQSQGRFAEAENLEREAVAICREMGDRALILQALWYLAVTLLWKGEFADSQSLLEESLAIGGDLALGLWLAITHHVLGKVQIHMGRYQEAHACLQQAMPLAQQSAVPWAIAMAFHGLGLVALVRAEYTEAQQYLQKSVSSLRESGQRNDESWMHAALGIAARGLGRQTQARECLCEALQASIEIRDVCMLMYALPVAALLLSDRGQVERAIEIYALASCYPFVARSTWFEAVVGQEIAAAAEVLAPQVVAEARERGRARDLWATVEELLDELANDGDQKQTS